MAETGTRVQKKEAEAPERIERTRAKRVYTPQVDIVEGPHHIVVTADMPGVDEKSADINLEKNVLSIYGKVEDVSFGNYRPLLVEYGMGDYERSFTLSDEIDRDAIQASVKNGVLKLVLPKVAAAKSRKIAVTAES
jgi:HSP20 family molecular chaperone IbpA